MKNLILLRHGQSEWNLENRFTGWTDVELSPKGREEARHAGELIAASGLKPRYCFTSYLRRAIQTLDIALDAMDRMWLPVVKDWHLNERHYGALQGLNKAATAEKYGDEQVHIWRRSYDVAPPAFQADDERFPGIEERYALLAKDSLPLTESLKDTVARVKPCWEELIAPALGLYDTVFCRRPRQFAPCLGHDAARENPGGDCRRGDPDRRSASPRTNRQARSEI